MSIHVQLSRRPTVETPSHLSTDQPLWSPIVIRLAVERDRASLDRLAALDDARRSRGPSLIAERQGRLVAALSLDDGRVIADPFVRTQDVVALLRVRAEQLGRKLAGSVRSR